MQLRLHYVLIGDDSVRNLHLSDERRQAGGGVRRLLCSGLSGRAGATGRAVASHALQKPGSRS